MAVGSAEWTHPIVHTLILADIYYFTEFKIDSPIDKKWNNLVNTGVSHKIGILLLLAIAQGNADQYFWNFVVILCHIMRIVYALI